MLRFCIGSFFLAKYRARVRESNVQTVARQLRKQGIPCEVAVLLLATGRGAR